jgi:copper ion binding protein
MDTIEKEIPVEGMTCGNCVRHVDKAIRSVPGVKNVAVDLMRKKAKVAYDPSVASEEAMAQAVKRAGYTLKTAA